MVSIEMKEMLSDEGITEIPPLPDTLRSLTCTFVNLSYIPKLPPNVRNLDLFSVNIKTLPSLPDSLLSLYIHTMPHNRSYFDNLEASHNLIYFDCGNYKRRINKLPENHNPYIFIRTNK